MFADLSAAPEIALLTVPHASPSPAGRSAARPTIGALARRLRVTASQPEQWWGKVRFSPLRYERIELEIPGMWIAVLAPGGAALTCDCDALTVLAGTIAEEPGLPVPGLLVPGLLVPGLLVPGLLVPGLLVPGPIRVHGEGRAHRLRAAGDGYAVSLHARGSA